MSRKFSVPAVVTSLALVGALTACGTTAEVSGTPSPQDDQAQQVEQVAESEPAAEVGTRENPAAIGQVVTISDAATGEAMWEVSLSNPVLDATAQVAAANQFNEAAPEGMVYAMVTVNAKRLGAEPATPWIDLAVEYVSAAGTTHASYDTSAVVPEPSFSDLHEMYTGAEGSGNVVIAVPAGDVAAGTWKVSDILGEPTFFAAQ